MNIYSSRFSQAIEFYVYEWLRSRKSKYGDIGTPYYVGKGKGNRAFSKWHRVSPPKDKNNIRISSLMNEIDAYQVEMLKIQLFGRIDLGTGCLRNMTDGGDAPPNQLGKKLSDETKKKMSISATGKIFSIEHNKRLSLAKTGTKHTEETKRKMSMDRKGIFPSEETKKKISISKLGNQVWLGRKHTEESKKKMSLAQKKVSRVGRISPNKGKSMSEEQKLKISTSKKGCIPWNKGKLKQTTNHN